MTRRTICSTRLTPGAAAAISIMLAGSADGGSEQIEMIDSSAWGGFFNDGPNEMKPTDFGFTPDGAGQYGAAAGNFITFSVEINDEPLVTPYQYDVEFNTEALDNGAGGGNDVIGNGSIDELDARTAFLYTSFVDGTLESQVSGFTYGEAASGASLQNAIWNSEEEIGSGSLDSLASDLVALADNVVNNGWSGLGQVRVMNLTDSNDVAYADMLVLNPELTVIPLPAPVLLGVSGLLGVGICGLRKRPQALRCAMSPRRGVSPAR